MSDQVPEWVVQFVGKLVLQQEAQRLVIEMLQTQNAGFQERINTLTAAAAENLPEDDNIVEMAERIAKSDGRSA